MRIPAQDGASPYGSMRVDQEVNQVGTGTVFYRTSPIEPNFAHFWQILNKML